MHRTRKSHGRTPAIAALTLSLAAGAVSLNTAPAAAAELAPRTYYVSSTGSDTATGLAPTSAWRTLQRAGSQDFKAGDRLLLQGGARFPGMLAFDARDTGTAAAPVSVGSYGLGRATIAPVGTPAIYAYNTAGLAISNLVLIGDATAFRTKGGVSFYSDLPAGRRLSGVRVSGLDVRSFRNGIEIGGRNAGSGFAGVVVTTSVLHDNLEAGLITYGPTFNATTPSYANAHVRVDRVQAYRNQGDPTNLVRNTGSGIVLGSVLGGMITNSRATGNGGLCRAPEGPVGIWTYDSHGIRIAYNLSLRNRTGGPADGDGFDLDQNVSGSIMERNTSRENDGAGYLVFTAQPNWAHRDNIVRYNTSYGDARRNSWYGGVTVVGQILRTRVYGNVINTATSPVLSPALALGGPVRTVTVSGNSLTAAAGAPVVVAPGLSRAAAALSGNRWTAVAQRIRWGTAYRSVPVWGAATGQS